MLALWDFFFWQNVAAADAVTLGLSGELSGTINVVSPLFSVGANGTISGTLVVTVGRSGGTGLLSQSVFSLSAGTSSINFTYLPTSVGTHVFTTTNNQSLSNATALSYIVGLSEHKGGGAKKPKHETYEPLPDEFWEERARRLTEDFIAREEAFTHLSVLEPNTEVAQRMSLLQTEKDALLSFMPQAPSVTELTSMAQRVKLIDSELQDLKPSRYTLVKKNIA